MKKLVLLLFVLLCASPAFAAKKTTYEYLADGVSGELILIADKNDLFLEVYTDNQYGNSCTLDNYECGQDGNVIVCVPKSGGDPVAILTLENDILELESGTKGMRLEDDFCGMNVNMSGKYKLKK